jgi:hypothetical protein
LTLAGCDTGGGSDDIPFIPSSNTNLAALEASTGTLVPAFNPERTAYTLWLENSASGVTISANAADSGARVEFSLPQPLVINADETKTVTIVVNAADGVTQKIYTVTVTREAAGTSSDASLAALTVQAGYCLRRSARKPFRIR